MVIVVFVKNKYILFIDMTNIVDKYSCAYLPIIKMEKNTIEKIVLSMYKNNI